MARRGSGFTGGYDGNAKAPGANPGRFRSVSGVRRYQSSWARSWKMSTLPSFTASGLLMSPWVKLAMNRT